MGDENSFGSEVHEFCARVIPAVLEEGYLRTGWCQLQPWRTQPPGVRVRANPAIRSLATPDYDWFRERGAFPRLLLNQGVEYPDGRRGQIDFIEFFELVPFNQTGLVYHATPLHLAERIRSDGLRPDCATNISTTQYRDSEHWIHVTASLEESLRWIHAPRLLANVSGNLAWTILSIRPEGTGGIMYPDPGSATGFVLPGDHVRPESLKVEVENTSVVR